MKTKFGWEAFFVVGPQRWNQLPVRPTNRTRVTGANTSDCLTEDAPCSEELLGGGNRKDYDIMINVNELGHFPLQRWVPVNIQHRCVGRHVRRSSKRLASAQEADGSCVELA